MAGTYTFGPNTLKLEDNVTPEMADAFFGGLLQQRQQAAVAMQAAPVAPPEPSALSQILSAAPAMLAQAFPPQAATPPRRKPTWGLSSAQVAEIQKNDLEREKMGADREQSAAQLALANAQMQQGQERLAQGQTQLMQEQQRMTATERQSMNAIAVEFEKMRRSQKFAKDQAEIDEKNFRNRPQEISPGATVRTPKPGGGYDEWTAPEREGQDKTLEVVRTIHNEAAQNARLRIMARLQYGEEMSDAQQNDIFTEEVEKLLANPAYAPYRSSFNLEKSTGQLVGSEAVPSDQVTWRNGKLAQEGAPEQAKAPASVASAEQPTAPATEAAGGRYSVNSAKSAADDLWEDYKNSGPVTARILQTVMEQARRTVSKGELNTIIREAINAYGDATTKPNRTIEDYVTSRVIAALR